MRTAMYREQHKALRDLVSQMPKDAEGCDPVQTRSILLKIAGALRAHLKLEDDHLYPDLVRDGDADVKAKAKRFQDEMGGLAGAFTAFYEQWSQPNAVANDTRGFVTAWRGVAGALAERMDREDNDLYATLDRLAAAV